MCYKSQYRFLFLNTFPGFYLCCYINIRFICFSLCKLLHTAGSHIVEAFLWWWIPDHLQPLLCHKQCNDEYPYTIPLMVLGKNLFRTYSHDWNHWDLLNLNTSREFSSIPVYTPTRFYLLTCLPIFGIIYFSSKNEWYLMNV